MTILILGGMEDLHACHILDRLRADDVDVELLDSRWFPANLEIAYDPGRDRGWLGLPTGRRLSLETIRAVYWRCYHQVCPVPMLLPANKEPGSVPDAPERGETSIALNDSRGMFESILIRLPTRWVNSWRAFHLHQTKPVQLALVASLGIPIPATILGNDPEAILDFTSRHPTSIFKPVQGGAHAQRLTPAHLTRENLANLSWSPVTIQAEIAGTNIRVFVAGEQVMACEIQSSFLDFRDDPDPCIVPHSLPRNIQQDCLRIAQLLDLLWTGIDFRLNPEGQYIFLEANPSPMFLGFESRTGLPLTQALIDLLLGQDIGL